MVANVDHAPALWCSSHGKVNPDPTHSPGMRVSQGTTTDGACLRCQNQERDQQQHPQTPPSLFREDPRGVGPTPRPPVGDTRALSKVYFHGYTTVRRERGRCPRGSCPVPRGQHVLTPPPEIHPHTHTKSTTNSELMVQTKAKEELGWVIMWQTGGRLSAPGHGASRAPSAATLEREGNAPFAHSQVPACGVLPPSSPLQR